MTKTQENVGLVEEYLKEEKRQGLTSEWFYVNFRSKVNSNREWFRRQISDLKKQGFRIGAYSSPAKQTVYFNFVGMNHELVDWVNIEIL